MVIPHSIYGVIPPWHICAVVDRAAMHMEHKTLMSIFSSSYPDMEYLDHDEPLSFKIIAFHLCVCEFSCMCSCKCGSVHTYVCVFLGRPEDSLGSCSSGTVFI